MGKPAGNARFVFFRKRYNKGHTGYVIQRSHYFGREEGNMKIHAPFAYHSVGCVRSYKFFPKLNNTDRKKIFYKFWNKGRLK